MSLGDELSETVDRVARFLAAMVAPNDVDQLVIEPGGLVPFWTRFRNDARAIIALVEQEKYGAP
jgi:hypothetical protein